MPKRENRFAHVCHSDCVCFEGRFYRIASIQRGFPLDPASRHRSPNGSDLAVGTDVSLYSRPLLVKHARYRPFHEGIVWTQCSQPRSDFALGFSSSLSLQTNATSFRRPNDAGIRKDWTTRTARYGLRMTFAASRVAFGMKSTQNKPSSTGSYARPGPALGSGPSSRASVPLRNESRCTILRKCKKSSKIPLPRFLNSRSEANEISIRLVTIEKPDWRLRAAAMLTPVATETPGVEAWLLTRENAALLMSELSKRPDYREHSSPNLTIYSGQTHTLKSTRPRIFATGTSTDSIQSLAETP